jgi:hypothetical protein
VLRALKSSLNCSHEYYSCTISGKMVATVASSAPVEHKTRPSKPDEEAFKASLAKVEKEHTIVLEKLVRDLPEAVFINC